MSTGVRVTVVDGSLHGVPGNLVCETSVWDRGGQRYFTNSHFRPFGVWVTDVDNPADHPVHPAGCYQLDVLAWRCIEAEQVN